MPLRRRKNLMVDEKRERAERMTNLRKTLSKAFGYKNAKEFTEVLGITKSRWSNVENGYPVSKDLADKLIRKFPGLTRDYIQEGEKRGLSLEMLQLLLPRGSSSVL